MNRVLLFVLFVVNVLFCFRKINFGLSFVRNFVILKILLDLEFKIILLIKGYLKSNFFKVCRKSGLEFSSFVFLFFMWFDVFLYGINVMICVMRM